MTSDARQPVHGAALRARRLGLFAQDYATGLMRADCHICRSEGLSARARVLVSAAGREVLATLYQVDGEWLAPGEVGLSEASWTRLSAAKGDPNEAGHAPDVRSFADVRRRLYGRQLDAQEFAAIVGDIFRKRYSDIHLSAFIAAGSAFPFDRDEIIHLTRAMVGACERPSWRSQVVVDKHCIGGHPDNRTTPIVVVHGLIADDSFDRLSDFRERVVSTDSVPHPSNAVSVAPILTRAIA